MKITLSIFGLALALTVFGVDVVTFTPSPTPNVQHVIQWGTNSGGTIGSQPLAVGGSLVMSNGPWGVLFYRAVAVSTNGVSSHPSNEVMATNRPGAPLNIFVNSP